MTTRNHRASALGIALAFRLVLPNPDGAIDRADRQQSAYCFCGIEAAELTTFDSIDVTRLINANDPLTIEDSVDTRRMSATFTVDTLESV